MLAWLTVASLLLWPDVVARLPPAVVTNASLEECLAYVFSSQPFTWGPLLFVTSTSPSDQRLLDASTVKDAVLRTVQLPVVLVKLPITMVYPGFVAGYIIDLPDLEWATFESLLTNISYIAKWSPRRPVLVIYQTETAHHDLSVKMILDCLDKRNAVESTVLVVTADTTSGYHTAQNVSAYTWFPYRHGHCRDDGVETALLGHLLTNGQCRKVKFTVFPEKVPKSLHGCPVKAATYHLPPFVSKVENEGGRASFSGYDVIVFQLIAKAANFSPVVIAPSYSGPQWGERLENGSWSGVVQQLLLRQVDAAFGGLHDNAPATRPVEASVGYLPDALTWFAPRARRACPLCEFGLIVPARDACLLLFGSLLLSVPFKLFSGPNEISDLRRLDKAFLFALRMLVTSPAREPRTLRPRIVFIFWLQLTYTLITGYQSTITSKMVRPGTEEQILTLEQLLRSDLRCGTLLPFQTWLKTVMKSKGPKIDYLCPTIADCMFRMAYSKDLAVMTTKVHTKFMGKVKYVDQSGRSLFLPFTENLFTYYVSIHVQEGSPLLLLFDDVILRVKAGALMTAAMREYESQFRSDAVVHSDLPQEEESQGFIALSHLSGAFTACAAALGMSFCVFIAELVYWRSGCRLFARYLHHGSTCRKWSEKENRVPD